MADQIFIESLTEEERNLLGKIFMTFWMIAENDPTISSEEDSEAWPSLRAKLGYKD